MEDKIFEDEEFNLNDIHVEKELKIVYMGTPEFSSIVLQGLLDNNYKLRAIVTQPDRPVGRDQKVTYSPVKQIAIDNTILVLQPEKLKTQYQEILDLQPDLIITCAYGQLIPIEILTAPRLGCINVHASLLPKLRGGAPIHRAIMEGYKKTGITIMYMNAELAEGDIISQREIEITNDDTAETLHDKLSIVGRDLLIETLPHIIDGTANRVPQKQDEATYGLNIKRSEEKINFSKSKKQIYNHIRGLNSWPGAYCLFDGKILKVWKCYETNNFFPNLLEGQITKIYSDGIGVKVNNGEVVFTEVQLEGKKRMSAIQFANGMANKGSIVGKILG